MPKFAYADGHADGDAGGADVHGVADVYADADAESDACGFGGCHGHSRF